MKFARLMTTVLLFYFVERSSHRSSRFAQSNLSSIDLTLSGDLLVWLLV